MIEKRYCRLNSTAEAPPIQRWYNRQRTVTPSGTDSRTDTSFGNDTDINKIVERFARTGALPGSPLEGQGVYDDVTPLQCDLTELIANQKSAMQKMAELEQQQREAIEAQQLQDQKDLAEFRAMTAEVKETPPSE